MKGKKKRDNKKNNNIDKNTDMMAQKLIVQSDKQQYNIYKKYRNKKIKNRKNQKILEKKNLKMSEKIYEKKNEQKNKKDLIFFDIYLNTKNLGKIVIKLFSDIVPKTCQNFRTLCQNKSYCNSPFHRIIKDFMIQGGDFTRGNGTGGMSIWGEKFEDENFDIQHDQPYLLSMANSGPNTNGSQFFITTNETPHLNGKHVVFGKVIEGFEIIDYLNNVETDQNDTPINNIIIHDCGVI